MKAKRPGTDQVAEFSILVNGVDSTEYTLPLVSTGDRNILECFIEIRPGDDLVVHGKFGGSTLHGAFDLVVDGTFAGAGRFDGNSIKYNRMTKRFTKALDGRKPPGWTSIMPPTKLHEGYMQVKQLGPSIQAELGRHEIEDEGVARPGIGSIAVTVSVSQDEFKHSIEDQQWHLGFGDWRERSHSKVRGSGIPPDLYIEPEVNEEVITSKRSLNHRRQWTEPRPGPKPWATFIFYYRTPETLDTAGCVRRPNDVHSLEPWDDLIDGAFVFFDKKDQATKSKAKKSLADQDDQSDANNGDARNSMFVSPAPTAPQGRAKSPKVAKKKGRLGGLLTLKKDGEVSIARLSDVQDDDALLMQPNQDHKSPLAAQQSAANPTKTFLEELPGANELSEDDGGLFVSKSDNGDHMDIAATGKDIFDLNGHSSSTARPDATSTGAAMGAALSLVGHARRGDVSSEATGMVNDEVQSDLDEYFDDEAAGLPLIAEAPDSRSRSGFSNAPEATRGHARASQSTHADTEPQSSPRRRTTSVYSTTPQASSRPPSTAALPSMAAHTHGTGEGARASLGSPAAINEQSEMDHPRRSASSKPSYANDKADDIPLRDTITASRLTTQLSDIDRVPSVATIRAAIPPEGIAIGQLANLLNSCGPFKNLFMAKKEFNKRVDEVAAENALGTRLFPRSSSKPAMAHGSADAPTALLQPIKQEVDEDDFERGIAATIEHQDTVQPAMRASLPTQAHATASIADVPTGQTMNPSHKRSASAMSPATSASDPPGKEARTNLEQIAERKAQALQQIEATNARIEATNKRKAAQRKAAKKQKREAAKAAEREAAEREAAEREAAEREAAEREAALIREQEAQAMEEVNELERLAAERAAEADALETDDMDMDLDMAYDDDDDDDSDGD
ncbi:unnamed protein product [Zymoseptoria tritici ST99CH_1E4]|uniref:Uncharacterized protein n=1 Tax=Zymoseptoria tritici ST99CH_1E4 TaxID=1276532 RepID=A0A2H1GNC4_ZYMTR|nr:unnamed protein product [Zymoseptoria tritici ST99CH_1E4]